MQDYILVYFNVYFLCLQPKHSLSSSNITNLEILIILVSSYENAISGKKYPIFGPILTFFSKFCFQNQSFSAHSSILAPILCQNNMFSTQNERFFAKNAIFCSKFHLLIKMIFLKIFGQNSRVLRKV